MRRHGELNTTTRKEPGKAMGKDDRSTARSHVPEWGFGRNVLSTINDMERMFEESFHRPFSGMPALPFRHLLDTWDSTGDFTPSVDIMDAEGEMVVKAELPGMNREDINVKLLDRSLIISGEKRTEEKVEKGDYLRMERSYGSFHRTLHLP